ncbi:MAG: hypothetical protein IB618_01045 [Candidatus Pacearchaeota archaeon]|nr:MAG: hypothetical protein IB618_01045 [Candidatus Pacearchaeota archaeon]
MGKSLDGFIVNYQIHLDEYHNPDKEQNKKFLKISHKKYISTLDKIEEKPLIGRLDHFSTGQYSIAGQYVHVLRNGVVIYEDSIAKKQVIIYAVSKEEANKCAKELGLHFSEK